MRDIKYLLDETLKSEKMEVILKLEKLLPFKIENNDDIEAYGQIFEIYCYFVKLVFTREEAILRINELLNKEIELNGETYWYLHQKAHILQMKNRELSDYYYALAALKSKNYNLFHMSRGIRIYRSDSYFKHLSEFCNSNISIPKEFFINNKKAKHICIASADPSYFKKYAQIFYYSGINMGINNESIAVHFHIINPDDECFAILKKLPCANYSIEKISLSPFVEKAYYTVPRYSIVLDLLSHYDYLDSFTIFDIDVAFDKNINYFLASFKNNDIGLVLNGMWEKHMLSEWSTICAGLSFFKNTKKNIDFIKLYNLYISNVFDFDYRVENANWLIDQMALYKCYKFLYQDKDVKHISRTSLVMPAQLHPGGKNHFIEYYKKLLNL